jgi:hypothetical protein
MKRLEPASAGSNVRERRQRVCRVSDDYGPLLPGNVNRARQWGRARSPAMSSAAAISEATAASSGDCDSPERS